MESDAEVLPQVGYGFIVRAVRIAFESALYGVYLLLISTSTIVLCRKIRRSKAAGFLLLITIIMFGASTTFLTMDLIDIIKRFQIILIDQPGQSLQEKEALANTALQQWMWTGEMLFIFMLILGDSIVVWRTWALFRGDEKWLIAPALTWIGSVVAAFFELGCDVKVGWLVESSSLSVASIGDATCAKADTASFTLSYATNLICTGLILYKAWMYRKSMAEYLGSARRRTQVEKIMTLLVESGAIYLVLYTFQAVPIYGGNFSSGSFIVVEAINAIIQQAMGMYPTAIVVLVEMQKSLYDTEQVSCERGIHFTSGIVFATRELNTAQKAGQTSTENDLEHEGSSKINLEATEKAPRQESIPG